MTDVLVIADTHLGPGAADRLVRRIGDELAAADVILHAGDITHPSVLDALAGHVADGRVVAVKGNNDRGVDLPERQILDIEGCTVGMIHDSGPAAGRTRRLRGWFPTCDVVVFGHSHLPWHVVDTGADGHVQHHLNPGSAMVRRRAPTCTVAHVVVAAGRVVDVRHVPVGPAAP
jgi:putative phosphoesterase